MALLREVLLSFLRVMEATVDIRSACPVTRYKNGYSIILCQNNLICREAERSDVHKRALVSMNNNSQTVQTAEERLGRRISGGPCDTTNPTESQKRALLSHSRGSECS